MKQQNRNKIFTIGRLYEIELNENLKNVFKHLFQKSISYSVRIIVYKNIVLEKF